MTKNEVRKHLKEYKYALDWIDIYNEKLESNMGVSFSHDGGYGGHKFHSDVEDKVLDREYRNKEYDEKKKFIRCMEKVLSKLPKDARLVIHHEYNIIKDDYYQTHQVGKIPVDDIIANLPFEKEKYYDVRALAYALLCNFMTAITV